MDEITTNNKKTINHIKDGIVIGLIIVPISCILVLLIFAFYVVVITAPVWAAMIMLYFLVKFSLPVFPFVILAAAFAFASCVILFRK